RYRLVLPAGIADRPGLEAEVEVVDGETTSVDLTAAARGRIDGTLRRRGDAVAGVAVEAVAERVRGADFLALSAVTDAFGGFHWDGLPDGRYRLRVIDGSVRFAVPVWVRRGERVTRDLELGEGKIAG